MTNNNFKEKFRHFRSQLVTFLWKVMHDWSFSLSALMGYNLLISLLPMTVCIIAVSSLLFSLESYYIDEIRNRSAIAFPGQDFANQTDSLLASLSINAALVSLIGFLAAIVGGSCLFVSIDVALTIIYRTRERSTFQQTIHAIKMLLVFVTLVPFIMIITLSPVVVQWNPILYQVIVALTGGLLMFALFNIIYYFVPARKMSFKNTWCGSLIATVGLQLLVLVFPVYVNNFMSNYVGKLGLIIIVLILFYIIGILFVFGAQINAFFFEQIQPLPAGLGTTISEYSNAENVKLIDGSIPLH